MSLQAERRRGSSIRAALRVRVSQERLSSHLAFVWECDRRIDWQLRAICIFHDYLHLSTLFLIHRRRELHWRVPRSYLRKNFSKKCQIPVQRWLWIRIDTILYGSNVLIMQYQYTISFPIQEYCFLDISWEIYAINNLWLLLKYWRDYTCLRPEKIPLKAVAECWENLREWSWRRRADWRGVRDGGRSTVRSQSGPGLRTGNSNLLLMTLTSETQHELTSLGSPLCLLLPPR